MLEKVHDELREKLMLEKCLANCLESFMLGKVPGELR